ncbi:hypothetical protein GE061_009849 [Apolygus lucorum]|uniref:MULE transposase domain-containing protein n=1 Tax=Apolygus lucorum TaxID=248454 RepID=A0A6A4KEL4_APOLU|nr:hypothetical protein GE061_009848 [Apolygus lucorum]KAF6215100.1 hypothetical protein GE061_009849 [Apolygus lucorum]
MLANSQHVIADGTFTYAPKHFYQLYTVHVSINGFHMPVLYAFLSGKSKGVYVSLWMNVKDLVLSLVKKHLQLTTFHVDFEHAAHKALSECFPNAAIYGCTFHLCQAWYRRLKKSKNLQRHYVKKTEEGLWLKQFFALCFLPPDSVYNAFTTLMMDAPAGTTDFTYYILTTYIEDDCCFPPQVWASAPPDNSLRTTNGAESFHRDFNQQFYSPHPNIHLVIGVLKEIQAEVNMKIMSVKKGSTNVLRAATRKQLQLLEELWLKFQEDSDVIAYLAAASNRYEPENFDD